VLGVGVGVVLPNLMLSSYVGYGVAMAVVGVVLIAFSQISLMKNYSKRVMYLLVTRGLLVVLAFFLFYLVYISSVGQGTGPSVATDVGLLITVILCVSISFWTTFAEKEPKDWSTKALLIVGLICGSVTSWVSGIGETFGRMGTEISYPAIYNNLSIAGDFLGTIAAILGLAAVLAFILILDEHVAKADIKAEMDRTSTSNRG